MRRHESEQMLDRHPELRLVADEKLRLEIVHTARRRVRWFRGWSPVCFWLSLLIGDIIRRHFPWRGHETIQSFVVKLIVCVAIIWLIASLYRRPLDREIRRELARRGFKVCAKCGYLLVGNVSGVCPECGTAVIPPPSKSRST